MERPLPTDFSQAGLFGPKPAYDYFADAARFPFRDEDAFRAANAWRLAEASLLAYVPDRARVEAALARAGVSSVHFVSRNSTHCFVAEGDVVLAVFRGTESGDLEDYKTDLKFRLDGHVHRGFREALDLVWDDVAARLDGRPCWFTGHSLGAALATLAAARYGASRPVYTFGSPRVGDAEFGQSFSPASYRIVNNNDFVAELPPPVRYRHVGELAYFDEAGRLHHGPDLGVQLRARFRGFRAQARRTVEAWRRGELGTVPLASIVDHSPEHYAVRCWNHLASR